jgi:hypothetical protein
MYCKCFTFFWHHCFYVWWGPESMTRPSINPCPYVYSCNHHYNCPYYQVYSHQLFCMKEVEFRPPRKGQRMIGRRIWCNKPGALNKPAPRNLSEEFAGKRLDPFVTDDIRHGSLTPTMIHTNQKVVKTINSKDTRDTSSIYQSSTVLYSSICLRFLLFSWH